MFMVNLKIRSVSQAKNNELSGFNAYEKFVSI